MLPFLVLIGVRGVIRDSSGNLAPSIRAHGCIQDMLRFDSQYPNCTEFDREVFQMGWQAGAEWADCNSCNSRQQ